MRMREEKREERREEGIEKREEKREDIGEWVILSRGCHIST